MITVGDILDALENYEGGMHACIGLGNLDVKLQITNDPPEFVDVEFQSVRVDGDHHLVIDATIVLEEDE